MTLSTVMKISYLLIALTASSFSVSHAIEAVLDINGSPVKPNVLYNIQSVAQPTQWVSRGKRVLDTLCPQAALLSSTPTAVKFLVDTESDSVPLSTDLSVDFDGVDECSDSGIWEVASNPLLPVSDITATGTVLAPESKFKIEKLSDGYKFAHWSDAANIGVYADTTDLINHLAIISEPALKVNFVPAPIV